MDAELLRQFFQNKVSREKRNWILRWLEEEHNRDEVLKIMRERWRDLDDEPDKKDEIDYARSWTELVKEMKPLRYPENEKLKKNRIIRMVSRIAASFIVLLTAGFLTWYYVQKSEKDAGMSAAKMTEKTTQSRQRLAFTLSDGTKVILNTRSSLQFPERFSDEKREVILKGEAYFDVAHDIRKPFIVKTGLVHTTALGTSFNINYRSATNDVRVSLTSGKVAVSYNVSQMAAEPEEHTEILLPGEEVVCSMEQREMIKGPFNIKVVTGWKEGILFFDEMNVIEIKTAMEKWYDVNITLENAPPLDWKYTGEFHNESLRNVLEGLSFSKKLSYEIDNNNVTIKFLD